VRVLFVSHTPHVSGAEHYLFNLLSGVREHVDPIVAVPPGALSEELVRQGVPVATISGTAGSLRLHPVRTVVALMEVTAAARGVAAVARRWRPDVVHANSLRAGVIAVAATSKHRVLVQAHDRLPTSRTSSLVERAVGGRAAGVLAVSHYVAEPFLDRMPDRVWVVDNAIDLDRFDPARHDRERERERFGLPLRPPVLGVVAQITPWKGQYEAIEVLANVRRRHSDACLVLAGEEKFVDRATRYDNRAYRAALEERITALGLQGAVRFLGEVEDVPALMRALDMLLMPSWEEPFGRAVVEAMAMEIPVLATDVGGPAEVITSGQDGVLLSPRQPEAWADAALGLIEDESTRGAIGARARRTAVARFGRERCARQVLAVYEKVTGMAPRRELLNQTVN
jgi:glycosyltransferase involved in cell wall biosynthesis